MMGRLSDGSSSFLDWDAMLYEVILSNILVILTKHGLVPVEQLRQTTHQFLGDPILAGFLEHGLQVVGNLRRHKVVRFSDPGCLSPSLVMSCSPILVKVPMVSLAASSKGSSVGLMQRMMPFPYHLAG